VPPWKELGQKRNEIGFINLCDISAGIVGKATINLLCLTDRLMEQFQPMFEKLEYRRYTVTLEISKARTN
jgi:hypothetical protein